MSEKSTHLQHVAIICDGNRRWAKAQGLPVFAGHQYAVDHVFEALLEVAAQEKIEYVTFWVFSTENWQRDSKEVQYLLQLLQHVFDVQIKRLHAQGIRVKVIGDMSKFSKGIQERIARGIKLTENNTAVTAVFALNYGGRDELVRAVNAYAVAASPEKALTAADFTQYLDTAEIPDPDYIIRTGGEQRLSGFLPWQSVYAELAFPEFYFPDFTKERFLEVLAEYHTRARRFGK